MGTKSYKEVVLSRYPNAVAVRCMGWGRDPKPGDKPTHWVVRDGLKGRALGSAGTTATAWYTAGKAIYRGDRRAKILQEEHDAVKAFVDRWAPPDLEAFRRTAQAFLDAERQRHDKDAESSAWVGLDDLWTYLTEKR